MKRKAHRTKEKKWKDKLLLAEFKTTLTTARNRADTMENRDMWDSKRVKKELDGRHRRQMTRNWVGYKSSRMVLITN